MDASDDLDRVLTASNAYQILGLSATANLDDAKKAYRELSRKLHPDKCTDPRSTDAFQRVAAAYERMKDPIMRHMEMGAAPGNDATVAEQQAQQAAQNTAATAASHKARAEAAFKAAAAAQSSGGERSGASGTSSSTTTGAGRRVPFQRERPPQRPKMSKEERMAKEREVLNEHMKQASQQSTDQDPWVSGPRPTTATKTAPPRPSTTTAPPSGPKKCETVEERLKAAETMISNLMNQCEAANEMMKMAQAGV